MDKRIGFGIVGLGSVSGTHAKALRDQQDCYLVGGFHKNREKADQWASENHCRAFYSLQEMLADPEIDAVSITTPSGYHLDPALAAIRAGKHVLIEKPMEITEDRINLLIENARAHHVLLCGLCRSDQERDKALYTRRRSTEIRAPDPCDLSECQNRRSCPLLMNCFPAHSSVRLSMDKMIDFLNQKC